MSANVNLILLALCVILLDRKQATLAQSKAPKCGSSLRVSHGEERVRSPWTALIFLRDARTEGVYVDWIAGVVVGPSTIITRGRQFWKAGSGTPQMNGIKAENLLVGVGIPNRKEFAPDEFTQFLEVAYVRPHPRSHIEHSEHDFAIVQLKSSITFSTKVGPICVPPADGPLALKVEPTSWTRVSGFRHWADFSLYTTDYKVTRADVCDATCQASPGTPSSTDAQLREGGRHCAPTAPGQDPTDVGDTFMVGSALLSWRGGMWYLTGLVTKSYGCSDRVKHFISAISSSKAALAWIHAVIRNASGRSTGYTCLNGDSVAITKICDGRADCNDGGGGSDEESTYCEAWGCPPGALNADTCNVENQAVLRVRHGSNSYFEVQSTQTLGRPGPGNMHTTVAPPRSTTRVPPTTQSGIIFGKVTSPTQSTAQRTTLPTPPPTTRKPVTTPPPQPTTTRPAPPPDRVLGGCPPMNRDGAALGTKTECRAPHATAVFAPASDCSTMQPPGTKMRLTCRPQYKPASLVSYSEWVCGTDGAWSQTRGRQQYFACILECGIPKTAISPQIVNGTDANISNWPWSASIFRENPNGGGFLYICGATLISARALLTAAHCVTDTGTEAPLEKERFRIVLTPTSISFAKNSASASSPILELGSIHVYHLYNAVTFEGDIAIIKTAEPVPISPSLYPVCYPLPGRESEQIERYQTSPGGVGLVVGFHTDPETLQLTDSLRKVLLPVQSVRECFKVLDIFPSSSQICAGHTTGVSVCSGDSGSGLIFQEEGARRLYFLQGVVSHGQTLNGYYCDYNRYSIFTRVASFKEWIEEIMSAV